MVKTASYAQVRQPMYKGSVELWKQYEKELEPLRKIIDGGVIEPLIYKVDQTVKAAQPKPLIQEQRMDGKIITINDKVYEVENLPQEAQSQIKSSHFIFETEFGTSTTSVIYINKKEYKIDSVTNFVDVFFNELITDEDTNETI